MRKTIRIMMWFLRKLYQCDKKRFGSMAALIVIRAIKTLLSVITIKVALDCVVTYHSFLYLVIFVATERVVSSLLALIESKLTGVIKKFKIIQLSKSLERRFFIMQRHFR